MTDAKFIPGLFFKDKHENAPDFVICKGSIKVADLSAFLSQQSDEWVNFDLKRSRDGKPYASVDDWKPNQGNTSSSGPRGGAPARERPERATDVPANDFSDDDIPFIRCDSRF
jgi:hypothetical protein